MCVCVYIYIYIYIYVSYVCYNKLPQAEWLKVTEIYSLPVVVGQSLKSRCQQCGQKNVACHFSKQRMLSAIKPSVIKPSGSAATLRGIQDGEKNRILALDSQDAYQKDNFNEPRLLHLPIHKKARKSLI